MTVTYLLRHARTPLSAVHRVNGDPTKPVTIDAAGVAQCHAVRGSAWTRTIATCVTSRFHRTGRTADLVLGQHRPHRVIEPRLDEVDYGTFEGGPWLAYGAWLAEHGPFARPPEGRESVHEATCRQLDGLAATLAHPGPRLVVAHGHLVSFVQHLHGRPAVLDELRFPEAAYVSPLVLSDDELIASVTAGRTLLAEVTARDDRPAAQR